MQALASAASLIGAVGAREAIRGELLPWLRGEGDALAERVAAEGSARIRSPRARELARRTLKPEALRALGFAD
jgi:hypothetical protein